MFFVYITPKRILKKMIVVKVMGLQQGCNVTAQTASGLRMLESIEQCDYRGPKKTT